MDRRGHRILRAQLERLSELPSLRAAAPRNIRSRFVRRYGKELLSVALKQVSRSYIVFHRWTYLMAFEAGEDLGP
jgi:hypothetical protein